MDNFHEFDPSQGYVALPANLLDLDLAPGPFRLLTELCRMANKDGECWPSLAQLSERIGRSKAALSGYLNDLRDAGLIETITQKMANGYNYRLKYVVTFWARWRSSLSKPRLVSNAQPKPERSVQHGECRVNSKNHNQKNQSGRHENRKERSKIMTTCLHEWMSLTRGTSYPDFNGVVPKHLVHRTQALLTDFKPEAANTRDTREIVRNIWNGLNVEIDNNQLGEQVSHIKSRHFTGQELKTLRQVISESWESHWRLPPTAKQFRMLLDKVTQLDPSLSQHRVLTQFLRRWRFAQNRLQHGPASRTVDERCAA